MPIEVMITLATITQIQAGSIGMKKNRMDDTAQIIAAHAKAFFLEPTFLVNQGERPPKTMQVASPNIMNTV